MSILDIGGRAEYWERVGIEFLHKVGAHVTLLNLTEAEIGEDRGGVFSIRVGDGTSTGFEDKTFDFVHSNSVIEHVGGWSNMRLFAEESRRIGHSYYHQTPYFWCPVDPHYARFPLIHWLPQPLRLRAFEAFPLAFSGRAGNLDDAHRIITDAILLDRRQFRYLFPEGAHRFEKVLGIPKSMIVTSINGAAP